MAVDCCVVEVSTVPPGAPVSQRPEAAPPLVSPSLPSPTMPNARIRYPRQKLSSRSPPAWPQRGCTLPSVSRTGRSLIPYLPVRAPLGSPSGAACSFHCCCVRDAFLCQVRPHHLQFLCTGPFMRETASSTRRARDTQDCSTGGRSTSRSSRRSRRAPPRQHRAKPT